MVAVFTIREYLKMGIASELEGAHGAYAQYLLDVRNEIIRKSLDELRTALESSISQLQSSLCAELRSIDYQLQDANAELRYLEQSIQNAINATTHQFDRLSATIEDAQEQTSAAFNAHMSHVNAHLSSANESLSRLQSSTDIIAINQYIANRMAGVDAYPA